MRKIFRFSTQRLTKLEIVTNRLVEHVKCLEIHPWYMTSLIWDSWNWTAVVCSSTRSYYCALRECGQEMSTAVPGQCVLFTC
jgi:hypothetical protein